MGFFDGLFGASKGSGNAATPVNPDGQNITHKPKTGTPSATQIHLKIGEIRDNVLVLKNGGVRTILKATSINFNLKSEEEQNAITYGYQGFLNSLEFPVQIIIRSKKLDIDDYIDHVKVLGEKQQNQLLKQQTFEYADFVKKLVEYTDIMQKEFYVIIPYDPIRAREVPFFQQFLQRLQPKDDYGNIKKRHQEFDQLKKNLIQRVNVVESGLSRCGIQTSELNTQELIELFYNIYNPQVSRTEKLRNIEKLTIATDEEVLKEEEEIDKQANK